MPQVYLLRHAKAGWARPGQRDFDRPLEGIGIDDATRLGTELRARKLLPAKVVSSSSMRTRQTVEALTLGNIQVEYLDALYEASPVQTLEIIKAQNTDSNLMIVGHNPVMEDLATALVENSESHPDLQGGFPTCGLAIIFFEEPLDRIEPGTGTLELFLRPADMK